MEQLRLMPRRQKRIDFRISDFGFRIFFEIFQGGLDGAAAGVAAQVRPGTAEQRAIFGVGVQTLTVDHESGASLAQRRLGDDRAITGRGTRDGSFVHEQVPLNKPDQQQGVPLGVPASSSATGKEAVSAAAITRR